jgi:hypothetical protein
MGTFPHCVCLYLCSRTCVGGMCTAQNIFFGDVLFVSGKPVEPVVNTKCVNKDCGIKLVADRDTMRVEGLLFPRSPSPFQTRACTCYCMYLLLHLFWVGLHAHSQTHPC